jgi:hypothetical protein
LISLSLSIYPRSRKILLKKNYYCVGSKIDGKENEELGAGIMIGNTTQV